MEAGFLPPHLPCAGSEEHHETHLEVPYSYAGELGRTTPSNNMDDSLAFSTAHTPLNFPSSRASNASAVSGHPQLLHWWNHLPIGRLLQEFREEDMFEENHGVILYHLMEAIAKFDLEIFQPGAGQHISMLCEQGLGNSTIQEMPSDINGFPDQSMKQWESDPYMEEDLLQSSQAISSSIMGAALSTFAFPDPSALPRESVEYDAPMDTSLSSNWTPHEENQFPSTPEPNLETYLRTDHSPSPSYISGSSGSPQIRRIRSASKRTTRAKTMLLQRYGQDEESGNKFCQPCNRGFSSPKDLLRHFESAMHAGDRVHQHRCLDDWECKKGSKGFPRYDNFKRHVKQVHSKTSQEFEQLFPRAVR
ncbi:hypothetical protein BT63DRAFT_256093 [Microthyrium microscopicum]|uniref:C2H2-type domain-containing protein n=1 Tax=Microthyrium microscopicum TaxID=703497 RepID=A0A6A6UBE2_9PEZI|nr:hypothetical protein BT63DRAFT_256093 [Microthyrium microscopicum]